MKPNRHRVEYKVAATAAREAHLRALEIRDQLKPRDFRILGVVAQMVTGYSRLEDRYTAGQIAKYAGYSGDRHVRESLKRLAQHKLIIWEPRRGRKVASRVGFYSPKTGQDETQKPDNLDTKTGQTLSDTREDFREVFRGDSLEDEAGLSAVPIHSTDLAPSGASPENSACTKPNPFHSHVSNDFQEIEAHVTDDTSSEGAVIPMIYGVGDCKHLEELSQMAKEGTYPIRDVVKQAIESATEFERLVREYSIPEIRKLSEPSPVSEEPRV